MATLTKITTKGYSINRKVGTDKNGCPRINLVKGMGINAGSVYEVFQSTDAKTITLKLMEAGK